MRKSDTATIWKVLCPDPQINVRELTPETQTGARRQQPVMRLRSGIKLLNERAGTGEPAKQGDRIIYNVRMFLNKGDEVPLNQRQAEYLPAAMIRTEDGYRFVDHTTTLGKRDAIAGIEHSVIGMRQGGYRKVRISPHLAYRDQGLDDLIPPNSVVIVELWLREIMSA